MAWERSEANERAHRARMEQAGLPEVAIRAFLRALRFVRDGGETTIPEASIEAVASLPGLPELDRFEAAGRAALDRACVIKLNGGLGTSMGLSRAKSLLPVRPGTRFLDLIARQVLYQRARWNVALPLLLMNSFRTRADSLAALAEHPELAGSLPPDFLQHKVPRIDAATGAPVEWPADPELEWCPPGHGDLYIALESSGMLGRLRAAGIRYAFASNADNLGAVLDPRLLGWFADSGHPFAMEVADRTEADVKGGHLARRGDRLILRERAQCPRADLSAFEDIARHRYFNTNNLWLDLDALAERLAADPDGLPLPVIRNEKHVVPTDPGSPRCVQLETAMGSAIECFTGAAAIRVPRTRFAPVKKTSDLLHLWSDAYELTDDERLVPVDPEASRARVIELDPDYYAAIDDFVARFPSGAPSLAKCRRLTIVGDHRFGADVSVVGDVRLTNDGDEPVVIPDGAVLEGDA